MSAQINSAFTLFLSLLVEAIPFLLLGVLLSSALLLTIDERKLLARLPRNPFLGAFIGGCAGFLFPVCECGNVPVARRLLLQGMPTSVAIGFLLAAPTINPIVIWSTWIAFRDRPDLVVMRIVGSLAIATIIGCVFSWQKDARSLLQPLLAKRLGLERERVEQSARIQALPDFLQSGTYLLDATKKARRLDEKDAIDATLSTKTPTRYRDRLHLFLDNLVQELRELGGMLILGSAIAASIQVFVPREIILNLGQDVVSSIVAMMFLAAVVSICSTVDSFFALSFASSFTSGSLLAFLVFGPTIDIKSIGLMLSIFRPRIIFYLFALVAQLTFILALFYSYFF